MKADGILPAGAWLGLGAPACQASFSQRCHSARVMTHTDSKQQCLTCVASVTCTKHTLWGLLPWRACLTHSLAPFAAYGIVVKIVCMLMPTSIAGACERALLTGRIILPAVGTCLGFDLCACASSCALLRCWGLGMAERIMAGSNSCMCHITHTTKQHRRECMQQRTSMAKAARAACAPIWHANGTAQGPG